MSSDPTPLDDDDITTTFPGDGDDSGTSAGVSADGTDLPGMGGPEGPRDSDSGDSDSGDAGGEGSAEDRDGVDQGVPGGTYGTQDAGRSDTLDKDGVDQGVPGGTHGTQDSGDGDADAGDR